VVRWEYAWVIYNPINSGHEDSRVLFTHREEQRLSPSSVVEIVGGLGDEGWELVSTMSAPGYPVQLWFKRPLE
jgi:hypothetical protein